MLVTVSLSNAQSHSAEKDMIEVEDILKKSRANYEATQKKIFRAEQKLSHLKKIGVLSYNDLTKKEQLLKKAKHKLKEMRLLIEHNSTLVKQTKSNPSFGKSIRSTNIAQSNTANSQKKTIQDIHNEKIQKLRDQQKQALISNVNKKRQQNNQQNGKQQAKLKQSQQKKNVQKNLTKKKGNN